MYREHIKLSQLLSSHICKISRSPKYVVDYFHDPGDVVAHAPAEGWGQGRGHAQGRARARAHLETQGYRGVDMGSRQRHIWSLHSLIARPGSQ